MQTKRTSVSVAPTGGITTGPIGTGSTRPMTAGRAALVEAPPTSRMPAPAPPDHGSPVGHDARTAAPERRPRLGLKATMVLVDTATTTLALALSYLFYVDVLNQTVEGVIAIAVLSIPIWPIAYAQQSLYQARRLSRRIEELRRLVNATAIGVVATACISVLFEVGLSRGWLITAGVFVLLLMALERELARRVVTRQRSRGRLARRVVLVGDNAEADELVTMLRQTRELGYEVVGRVSNQPPSGDRGRVTLPYLGGTDDIVTSVRSVGASSVIVATTGVSLETANRIVRDLTREGIYVELSSAMRDIATRRVTLRPLGRYPVMCVEPVTSTWRSVAKRCFDATSATLGLVLVSPILLSAALAIRVTSGPGVFFTQTRVGRHGNPFTVYKLRTMVHDAESMLPELMAENEASGPMFKMTDDPRVTPVGRFLRKTSIDELPQLINVVKGDMSLVGPRPALPHEAVQWNDDLKERLRVKPGITGNWQVNGRFTASLEDYQRLDLYYVDNWSLVSDLVILAKSIPAVLQRNGAV